MPDFVGLGAPRAGTSWLFQQLSAHPQVRMASPKEVHYFDWHVDRSPAWYASHFSAEPGAVNGEVTPAYGHWLGFGRRRLMRTLLPNARFIYILRDPVERAWSHCVKVLEKDRKCSMEEVPAAQILRFIDRSDCLAAGRYARNLRHWQQLYPAERFHIGFYEDIAKTPKGLLKAVFEHIGVTTDVDWSRFPLHKRYHTTRVHPIPAEVLSRLRDAYAPDVPSLRAMFGDRTRNWVG